MGGGTGNIRTLRNQSGSAGYRTLGSILASDSGSGAGSVRRIYGYYSNQGVSYSLFYNTVLNLDYGKYKGRTDWFLKSI